MKRDLIEIAQIHGPSGLTGKIKILPYGESFHQFQTYSTLIIGKSGLPLNVLSCIQSKGSLVIELEGISSRAQVERLKGEILYIERDQLPPVGNDEHYWADLIGLNVVDMEGNDIGDIVGIFPTGSNDVYIVNRDKRYFIPATEDVVKEISIENGYLRIDLSLLEGLLD
ncbi:MAG: ribosome maturation factor RimM [Desulfomonilia bacterium]